MPRLYFDYNATAPLAPGLAEQLKTWAEADPKNPVSVHQDGQAARKVVEDARKRVLQFFGAASQDQLIFTSGGTESNNTILHSAFLNRGDKNKLLLSQLEHSCIFNYAKFLEKQYGVELVWVEIDRLGHVDIEDYRAKLRAGGIFLATVMLANNETGFIFPIKKLAEIAHELGTLFHTDAVCIAGKKPISFKDLGVDSLSFSSHKFGGLKGSGGLIVRKSFKLSPYLYGGTHEFEKRAGTHNVFGIAATAFALDHVSLEDPVIKHESELRQQLKQVIQEAYPDVVFIESPDNLPQTLNAAFVGLHGNLLLTNLDLEGISASYGSACASGALEISRVIRSLEISVNEARASLRFSFGQSTTADEVLEFGKRLKKALTRMREN